MPDRYPPPVAIPDPPDRPPPPEASAIAPDGLLWCRCTHAASQHGHPDRDRTPKCKALGCDCTGYDPVDPDFENDQLPPEVSVDDAKLLSTTDAAVWAGEFHKLTEAGVSIDEGLMIGWFANAIETARRIERDEWQRRLRPLREALEAIAASGVGTQQMRARDVIADDNAMYDPLDPIIGEPPLEEAEDDDDPLPE